MGVDTDRGEITHVQYEPAPGWMAAAWHTNDWPNDFATCDDGRRVGSGRGIARMALAVHEYTCVDGVMLGLWHDSARASG